MTCFEARQEFRPLWLKSLPPGRRREMIEHLERCAMCDGAFRLFALTAPALHSDPPRARVAVRGGAPAASSIAVQRTGATRRPRNLAAIGAAISLVAAAGLAAWMAIAVPGETMDYTLSHQQPAGELFGGADMPPALNDIAR